MMGNRLEDITILVIDPSNKLTNFLVGTACKALVHVGTAAAALEECRRFNSTEVLVFLSTEIVDAAWSEALCQLNSFSIAATVVVVDSEHRPENAVIAGCNGAWGYLGKPDQLILDELVRHTLVQPLLATRFVDIFLLADTLDKPERLKLKRMLAEKLSARFCANVAAQMEVSTGTNVAHDRLMSALFAHYPNDRKITPEIAEKIVSAMTGMSLANLPRGKALVVETTKMGGRRLKKHLMQMRFDVLLATDGKSAIEILEANRDISIVFLDAHLQDISSATVLSHLAETNPQAVVVALANQIENSELNVLIKRGAVQVLLQPFGKVATQRAAVRAWLKRNWPVYHGKIGPRRLSRLQRLLLLNDLFLRSGTGQKILAADVLSLFPEFLSL